MEQSRPLGLEHEEVPLKESSMSNASEEQVAALRTLYLKARPYACHSVACGKKYRNPGGLKYHYLHSGAHGEVGAKMMQDGTHATPGTVH